MTEPLLCGLREVGRTDVGLVGGKGANLGALLQAGFPVPEGFVVTTAAYAAAMPSGGEVPDDLADEVRRKYRALGGGPVAVRSSATAEDLPGAAFAGQHDTFLNVVGEADLLAAVAACWASLGNERATAYRAQRHVDPASVAMAVVVQRMVPAEVAGVMFGANPLTGRRDEIVVEASAGLGEAVVSGSVDPDRYVLDPRGRPRTSPPPALLTADQLRRLADLTTRANALFGGPQDLEWAYAEGRVWLTQSRPMTALPVPPPHLNLVQRRMAPFFVEMFQQRPLPLDASGWLARAVAPMLSAMAGSVGLRLPERRRWLPEEDGVAVGLVPPVPRATLGVLRAPLSIARRARRYRPEALTADPRLARLTTTLHDLADSALIELSWPELLARVELVFRTTGLLTQLRVDYLPAAFLEQGRLLLWLTVLGRRALGADLLSGVPTRTAEVNAELQRLAEEVRTDRALRRAFADRTDAELLDWLPVDPAGRTFDARLTTFLHAYGHRETVSPVISSAPTWADAPVVVVGLVRALLDGADRPVTDRFGPAYRRLLDHPWLRRASLRRRTERLVADARAGAAVREDTHFYLTLGLPPLRRTYVELGRRLVAAGVLDRPEDVFYLTDDQLHRLTEPPIAGGPAAQELRDIVVRRREKVEQLRHVPLLSPDLLAGPASVPAGALLAGTPASRGRASGPVRVITRPEDFGSLRDGEVLVCPYTNPAWTPLFQRACAVVVDTGGLASHAAIVAREYGVPAVMGTRTATTVLATGQWVTVDGDRGMVLPADAPSGR